MLPGLLSLRRAVAVPARGQPPPVPASLLLLPAARLVWPCNFSSGLSRAVRLWGRGREEKFRCFAPTVAGVLLTEWFTQGEIGGRGWTDFPGTPRAHISCILNISSSTAPSSCSHAWQLPLGTLTEAHRSVPLAPGPMAEWLPRRLSPKFSPIRRQLGEPRLGTHLWVRQALRGLHQQNLRAPVAISEQIPSTADGCDANGSF